MANDDWRELSIDNDLTAEQRELYLNAKLVYRDYKAAKELFEQSMQAGVASSLPKGMELKFGYNFGKLSVAIGPKREAKAKKRADGRSLNDWLQAQRAGGRAS